MRPDFNRMLYTTEDILWEGESSTNVKSADSVGRRNKYVFTIVFACCGILMIAAAFSFNFKGSSLISALCFAAVFIFIAFMSFRSARKFKHEYYCLTGERLIIIDDKNYVTTHELMFAKDSEITVQDGDYGSVLVFTAGCTKKDYHADKKGGTYSKHTSDSLWCLNGVKNCEEFVEHLKKCISDPVNDPHFFREKLANREYKDKDYSREEDEKFREQFMKHNAKRIRKMQNNNIVEEGETI